MSGPHYRKIELQSPADFSYLYANTVALSRRKLDLHLPPSASGNDPDPMRERVRELVDEFIDRTFTTAASSISINGLDSSSSQFPFPTAFATPETVEYEQYDGALASRLTSLYAQLESLTTTVAQLRRDAPGRAARGYAEELKKALAEDDAADEGDEEQEADDPDVPMTDATKTEDDQSQDPSKPDDQQQKQRQPRRTKQAWRLSLPLGSAEEESRWRNGEIDEVYSDALRTLLQLQGEAVGGDEHNVESAVGGGSKALATTVGKAERASRAVEVVEKM